ncbi:DUF2752 domain-containing protein [Sediminibacterium sp.]|uniref:DUF2752 domain-containing protein n=1 Tax=Sediminibacterium sp. TaxID=1917865 RepID=UPI0025F945BA|nr:DUF2752 domain-containing protein [Sediminibacterium sp.]MBW0178871.1 DUF2752 domain-containing protein [Sediminibacterium sp.]
MLLFFLPGYTEGQSLCVSTLLQLGKCPGCGIGHAIHDALHFRFSASFQHHPMGIFAVIIIFIRIKQLITNTLTTHETQSVQPDSRT